MQSSEEPASRREARVVDLHVKEFPAGEGSRGPTIIFVHGLDSWSGTWYPMAAELNRRGLTCIAVDLRGHGRSPMGSPEDFSPAQLAADVRAALRKAGVLASGRALLVGHSMGGKIALRYAADYPEDLAGVVIEDMDCTCREYSAAYMNPGPEEVARKSSFSRDFQTWEACRAALVSFGYDEKRVDGWRTESPPRVFALDGGMWSAINPYAQWLARQTVLSQADAYEALQRLAAVRACGRPDLAAHVLVAGPGGTVCSWEGLPGGVRDMEAVLPGLVVTEFPTAAHSIHNSELQAFADLIQKVAGSLA